MMFLLLCVALLSTLSNADDRRKLVPAVVSTATLSWTLQFKIAQDTTTCPALEATTEKSVAQLLSMDESAVAVTFDSADCQCDREIKCNPDWPADATWMCDYTGICSAGERRNLNVVPAHPRRMLKPLEECTGFEAASIDIVIKGSNLVYNNINGMGPDTGPEFMQFNNVDTYDGKAVHLRVSAVGYEYEVDKTNNGFYSGDTNDFGLFKVKEGNSHTMKFELVDDDDNLVVVPTWYLSMYDIDGKDESGSEPAFSKSFYAKGFTNRWLHAGTYITETPAYIPTDGVADWVKYTAREEKVSNPTAKSGLDNGQLKAAVQFQYSNTAVAEFKQENSAGRGYMFAGASYELGEVCSRPPTTASPIKPKVVIKIQARVAVTGTQSEIDSAKAVVDGANFQYFLAAAMNAEDSALDLKSVFEPLDVASPSVTYGQDFLATVDYTYLGEELNQCGDKILTRDECMAWAIASPAHNLQVEDDDYDYYEYPAGCSTDLTGKTKFGTIWNAGYNVLGYHKCTAENPCVVSYRDTPREDIKESDVLIMHFEVCKVEFGYDELDMVPCLGRSSVHLETHQLATESIDSCKAKCLFNPLCTAVHQNRKRCVLRSGYVKTQHENQIGYWHRPSKPGVKCWKKKMLGDLKSRVCAAAYDQAICKHGSASCESSAGTFPRLTHASWTAHQANLPNICGLFQSDRVQWSTYCGEACPGRDYYVKYENVTCRENPLSGKEILLHGKHLDECEVACTADYNCLGFFRRRNMCILQGGTSIPRTPRTKHSGDKTEYCYVKDEPEDR